ncbi:MAG: hypothetical protein ACKOXK_08030 [Chakrabartia sp.]
MTDPNSPPCSGANPDAGARQMRTMVDLPSLLATTAAHQAMTPTAQVQARLSTRALRGDAEEKSQGTSQSEKQNSSSFNYLTRKLLCERAMR